MKKLVLAFAAIVTLFPMAGCTQFWQIVDKETIDKYNSGVYAANQQSAEHDALVKQINSTINNPVAQRVYVDDYLSKSESWMASFGEFKMFLETNEEVLERSGVNASAVRDNAKSMLDLIRQNDLRFREAAMRQDAYKQLMGAFQ